MISLWTELFRKRQFQRFPLLFSPGILFIIYTYISSKWAPCFDGANWLNYTKNSFFYLINKHLSLECPSSEMQFLSANIDSPTSWQCSFGQSTSPLNFSVFLGKAEEEHFTCHEDWGYVQTVPGMRYVAAKCSFCCLRRVGGRGHHCC